MPWIAVFAMAMKPCLKPEVAEIMSETMLVQVYCILWETRGTGSRPVATMIVKGVCSQGRKEMCVRGVFTATHAVRRPESLSLGTLLARML